MSGTEFILIVMISANSNNAMSFSARVSTLEECQKVALAAHDMVGGADIWFPRQIKTACVPVARLEGKK